MSDCKPLDLEEYRSLFRLHEVIREPSPASESITERTFLVDQLLEYLLDEFEKEENEGKIDLKISSYEQKRTLLYRLLTVRKPLPFPSWFHNKLDSLLQREKLERPIIDAATLPYLSKTFPMTSYGSSDLCVLWQGDITTLKIDAIVNAANKYLLGCFQPFHKCIDNVIHSAAGPHLREDCNKIIQKQGCLEGTGWAKITHAYNLPSKYILHTVGPIFNKNIIHKQEQELAACYKSCLALASRIRTISSIAFCSISTGIFGFPMKIATRIALETVNEWLGRHPNSFDRIVFNVYSREDYLLYKNMLKNW